MIINATVYIFSFLLLFFSCASSVPEGQLSISEKKAKLYYQRGTSFLLKKNYPKALSHLIKSVEFKSKDTKAQNNLGMAYFFSKAYQRAEKHLKLSIEINPENGDALNNLASLYYTQKKDILALDLYYKLINDLTYSKQFRTFHNIGLIYLRQGRKAKALENFKKAVDVKDDYCPSHFQIGQISENGLNYSQALRSYKSATMGTCYQYPAPHFQQAQVLLSLGENEKALLKLKEIIENFPESKYSKLASRKLKTMRILNIKKERLNRNYNPHRNVKKTSSEVKSIQF